VVLVIVGTGSAEYYGKRRETMRGRKQFATGTFSENAMTWFFSGMVLIALVAGLLSQVDLQ
jgi:hypothetical protein